MLLRSLFHLRAIDTDSPDREMKKALESYWAGKEAKEGLLEAAKAVEGAAWKAQADAGIDLVALDGTLYDQMLDHATFLGLVPARFQHLSGLDKYFAAARGTPEAPACDMSKLADTNYHYLGELEGWIDEESHH